MSGAASFDGERPFTYRNCQFTCTVTEAKSGTWQHAVLYRSGLAGMEPTALPPDTSPYASAPEAMRHAEQQAVRWVHDRTGDGKGRF